MSNGCISNQLFQSSLEGMGYRYSYTSGILNRCLLAIMEYLSKWVATNYQSFRFSHTKHGLLSRLISGNNTNYILDVMNLACSRLGISKSLISVEHPQTDGLIERMSRTLKPNSSFMVGGNVKAWARHLFFVVLLFTTPQDRQIPSSLHLRWCLKERRLYLRFLALRWMTTRH